MASRFLARPRGLAVALVAAGTLVVAGCTGSGEETTSPTTGATSPTTVTPTPTATTETGATTEVAALPPLPDAAKENTPEGAEAFIRYYFDVVNLLHREPQQGVLATLTDPECESCTNAEETIAYLAEEGTHLVGDLYQIDQLSRIGGGDPGVTRFDGSWRGPGTSVVNIEDEVVDQIPPAEFRGIMAAMWTGDGWVFYDSAVSE